MPSDSVRPSFPSNLLVYNVLLFFLPQQPSLPPGLQDVYDNVTEIYVQEKYGCVCAMA